MTSLLFRLEAVSANAEAMAQQAYPWGEYEDTLRRVGFVDGFNARAPLDQAMRDVYALAERILTLTHDELSDVEMNTLTTRQYMLWSRSKELANLEAVVAEMEKEGG